MSKLTQPQLLVTQRIGERMAKRIFDKRGKRGFVLMSEGDLDHALTEAAELGIIACTVPMYEVTEEQRSMMVRTELFERPVEARGEN